MNETCTRMICQPSFSVFHNGAIAVHMHLHYVMPLNLNRKYPSLYIDLGLCNHFLVKYECGCYHMLSFLLSRGEIIYSSICKTTCLVLPQETDWYPSHDPSTRTCINNSIVSKKLKLIPLLVSSNNSRESRSSRIDDERARQCRVATKWICKQYMGSLVIINASHNRRLSYICL